MSNYQNPMYAQQPQYPPHQYAYQPPAGYPQYAAYPAPYYAPQQPYYAPPPPAVAQPEEFNKNLKYEVKSSSDGKSIVLSNVEVAHDVDVTSNTLSFKRGEHQQNGQLPFSFVPDGNKHEIKVLNQGKPVHTFTLSPKPVEVKFTTNGGSKFELLNVHNPENIRLQSDKHIQWHLVPSKNSPTTYTLNFDAQGQVQNIQLFSIINGERVPIQNGKILLAPKNKPEAPAPMAMMANPQYPMYGAYPPPQYAPQYGYPPQPPMYYHSQPMYAIQGPPRA